jgi:hypothetical protein
VEQRTDQVVPQIHAAGTDPAYIPGLTPPPASPADGAEQTAPPADPVGPAADGGPAPDAEPDEWAGAETADEPAEEAGEAPPRAAPEPDDGPVFEATDRRGAIVADHAGITLRLDGEAAEFGWDEIGAVEVDTPRFGKRFSVTVYTSGRRWFQGDVEAPSRSVLKDWVAGFDAVLDVRFEESADAAEEAPAAEPAS